MKVSIIYNYLPMMSLSNEQISWICRNYADMRNADLCARVGISKRQLGCLRRLHGLKKSEERICNLSKSCNSDAAYAAMAKRRGESLRKVYRQERRRVLFGLEQRTRLRAVRSLPEKYRLRCNMRKRGYEIKRGGNDVSVTADTLRSKRMEDHAERIGMRIVELFDDEL